MSNSKFKKGDWCFCEFVLKQVQETDGDAITQVSDGRFNLSSSDLSDRCFPLTIRIKNISDTVKYYSDKFHSLNHNSLNYPDLNRELIRRWVEMCEYSGDDKGLQTLYNQLDDFANSVERKVDELKYQSVEGIPLFRR